VKTPDGKNCKFFYGDYYRGRDFEECRAIPAQGEAKLWNSRLCKTCAVPDILRNNACPNLILSVTSRRLLSRIRMKVFAYCTVSHKPVKDPNIGCGHCHEN